MQSVLAIALRELPGFGVNPFIDQNFEGTLLRSACPPVESVGRFTETLRPFGSIQIHGRRRFRSGLHLDTSLSADTALSSRR